MRRFACPWSVLIARCALTAMGIVALSGAASAEAGVKLSGGFSYVTKRYDVSGPGVRKLKAPCPAATHVYGGGHYNSSGFAGDVIATHSYPYDSRDRDDRPDDGWAIKLSSSEATRATAYATCAGPIPRYRAQSLSLDAGNLADAGALCKGSTHVLGGGSRGPTVIQEVSTFAFPPALWRTSANAVGAGTLTSYAICGDLPVSYVSSAGSATGGTQAVNTASCPAGTHVIAGGLGGYWDTRIAASRPLGIGAGPDRWEAWINNYAVVSRNFGTGAVCAEALTG